MKVFIFGISGFLGSHLCDALKSHGYYVGGIDTIQLQHTIPDEFYLGDARWCCQADPPYLHPWDYVFHCAGPAGPANINPGYALRQIIDITAAGLDFAQKCRARFLKFSSSE